VARGLPGVALEAVAVHIGSQLTQVAPFEAAFARVAALAQELAADGSRLKRSISAAAGRRLQPAAEPWADLAAYAAAVRAAARATGLKLVLEPGRWMVADAGILLARVIQLKDGVAKRFNNCRCCHE